MEPEELLISGLMHLTRCPRRWALIHMEGLWSENRLTAEGKVLHERVHSMETESRDGVLFVRGLPLRHSSLGLYGVADLVEFHNSPEGIALSGRRGLWLPFPVEYKRGRDHLNEADRVQLCAQALCLEDMLKCSISEGAIFYGEPRRRKVMELTASLRVKVANLCTEANKMLQTGQIPLPRQSPQCKGCSMSDQCAPSIPSRAKAYVEQSIEAAIHETPEEYTLS